MKPKMNIFKQYFYAVTNPKKYGEMTRFGAGRIFLYLVILSLFTVICALALPITAYFQMGGIEKVVDSYVPDFSYKSGKLKTDIKIDKSYDFQTLEDDFADLDFSSADSIYDSKVIENIRNITLYAFLESFSQIDINEEYSQAEIQVINDDIKDKIRNESFYLYLDTSVSSVSDLITNEVIKLDEITDDNAVLITGSDFAVLDKTDIKNAIENNSITTYPFDNSIDVNLSKSDFENAVKDILPVMYSVAAIIIFVAIFVIIIGWLISSLIFAILALIANAATHKHFTFGTLFKVSVYSHTTAIILCALLNFIPNEPAIISTIIRWIVPIIYIVLAILYMDDTQTPYYNAPFNGQNNYPPFNGQNNYPPFNGQNNQPPFNGQNNYPPFNGQNNQPPFNGQNNQPPFNGQNNQPPFNGQNNQPPFNGQNNYPPQNEPNNYPGNSNTPAGNDISNGSVNTNNESSGNNTAANANNELSDNNTAANVNNAQNDSTPNTDNNYNDSNNIIGN